MTTVIHRESGENIEVQGDILAPLRFFYGLAKNDLQVTFVSPDEMPKDSRWLLVHESDMTPRLTEFHQSEIGLNVHAKSLIGSYLVRASVLHRISDQKPVEFGAIGIHLETFDIETRSLILEAKIPLGGILKSRQIPHSSHPRGFFKITIDDRLAQLLDCPEGHVLFGRCNELRHSNGQCLADVVEVLPQEV